MATKTKKEAKTEEKKGDYLYGIGRRKRAVATVRIYPEGKGEFTVNDKPLKEYMPVDNLQENVLLPLKAAGMDASADVTVRASGGGPRGQSDAIKLGVARALLKMNEELRATLKPLGALKRDPRRKERKKYGLKKARRAPQWAKR